VNELMDEDEKDRAKRASRNKSEKKRRDQFNVLIKELCTMLQGHGHPLKMDKSTILQRTIDFLQKQKEITAQTEACEIRQDWKPSFLSNEEFTQLMLEALDGFLIALTTDGIIIYVSDSVSSLLGHLPSDLVDQNILNFLPEREQSEVYKLLSPRVLMTDSVAADFLNTEKQIEFCCHLARGSLDPNEPLTYEYVKFVVDFKYFTHACLVPTPSCNGFESAIARAFRSATEEQVCLVATVRLVTPQFLKELCNVEEPCEEFTSRHSLEWKFLFLDHRAPPIIGYLPFEVLGTSGYDYYHADDLELLARCHEHLMQFGKGKSCYYRFLTKGQQWIWLQTHYYITYHQWNSKPEFIVCTHLVVSYAEVRAERRRDLGLEESSIELASSSLKVKNQPAAPASHNSYIDIRQCGANQDTGGDGVSRSSPSSRRSSHTALSDSACTYPRLHWQSPASAGGCTHGAVVPAETQPVVPGIVAVCTRPAPQAAQGPNCDSERPALGPVSTFPRTALPPVYHFPAQLGMMHQLKEQLEERTRILQADIKTQQEELHVIKEQLQLVQDSNLQMLMQQPMPVVFNNVQPHSPRRPSQAQQPGATRQTTAKKSQPQGLMGSKHYSAPHLPSPHQFLREPSVTSSQVQQQQQQQALRGSQACLPVQTSISMPLYNSPMVFSQTHALAGAAPLPAEMGERQPPSDYSPDRSLRMLLDQPVQTLMSSATGSNQSSQNSAGHQQANFVPEQQMLPPPLQMQPITCSTVRVPAPSPVFTPSVMIPQANFTSHQTQPPVHLHQWPPQQQGQMQAPEPVQGSQNQRLFQPSHLPPQNVMGYFLHPQQQSLPPQGQACNLQDLPEMQLP
uniref:Neuronal PAS domain protein 2 n=1 Tax=Pelodiscus sinensis TaxID=13735 RepID=K7GDD4_PELSI